MLPVVLKTLGIILYSYVYYKTGVIYINNTIELINQTNTTTLYGALVLHNFLD